jgi:exosome complex exonuclease DIS3/RRP44
VVKEHYLRDDITCGVRGCALCAKYTTTSDPTLSENTECYLVLDTNVVLHQIDLLEHSGFQNSIVFGVVLEEVKHRNINIYNRLRAIIANPDKHFFVFSNEHHK